MARKPVNEVKSLQTRDAIWEAIRKIGGSNAVFTSREVRRETCCSRSQIDEYIAGLTAAGYLRIVAEKDKPGSSHLYTLENDCGIEAPRVRRDGSAVTQGLGREQMWRTMRLLKEFTALDLAIQASTEEAVVQPQTATEYCRYLALAGYLTVISKGRGKGSGGVPSRYRFVPTRNSGPMPPMLQRTKQVFDPNLDQVVWSSEEGRHDTE